MTILLYFDLETAQEFSFITNIDDTTTSEFIEFEHEQSKEVVSDTFVNSSVNLRLITFSVTQPFFTYDGWYTYTRYTNSAKTTLIETGKCYLQQTTDSVEYDNNLSDVKKIYKG